MMRTQQVFLCEKTAFPLTEIVSRACHFDRRKMQSSFSVDFCPKLTGGCVARIYLSLYSLFWLIFSDGLSLEVHILKSNPYNISFFLCYCVVRSLICNIIKIWRCVNSFYLTTDAQSWTRFNQFLWLMLIIFYTVFAYVD